MRGQLDGVRLQFPTRIFIRLTFQQVHLTIPQKPPRPEIRDQETRDRTQTNVHSPHPLMPSIAFHLQTQTRPVAYLPRLPNAHRSSEGSPIASSPSGPKPPLLWADTHASRTFPDRSLTQQNQYKCPKFHRFTYITFFSCVRQPITATLRPTRV